MKWEQTPVTPLAVFMPDKGPSYDRCYTGVLFPCHLSSSLGIVPILQMRGGISER